MQASVQPDFLTTAAGRCQKQDGEDASCLSHILRKSQAANHPWCSLDALFHQWFQKHQITFSMQQSIWQNKTSSSNHQGHQGKWLNMDKNETNVLVAVGKICSKLLLVKRKINVTLKKGTCGVPDICLFIHHQLQYGISGCQLVLDCHALSHSSAVGVWVPPMSRVQHHWGSALPALSLLET